MEIYAWNNTHCVYQESDLLGPLYPSRKKSNAEFHFDIKSFFGNFSVLFTLLICWYIFFFLKESTDFWRKYLEICNFLIIYRIDRNLQGY